MPRISPLEPADMNTEQRRFHDNIMSGPRGGMGGPFQAWIHSPVFADRAQHVGEYCRFNSVLETRLSELAILITARQWTAQFEWFAHAPMALEAGLSPDIIADLRERREPTFSKADEAAVFKFCTELYRASAVSDATYDEAKAQLGEQGVVDLVGILGYYALVSMTLNVFEMPLPDGVEPPLSA
ncbi:MAG: carboxymuconolactone decarboxylase family protein [Proteobacteria bacterium]|nr:carboxymuconolactone decarboxylase family protein [Pseudomonadota bacterium]